jgi:hypothetical protein
MMMVGIIVTDTKGGTGEESGQEWENFGKGGRRKD